LNNFYEKKARYYDLDVVYYAITRDRFKPGDAPYRVYLPGSS